MRSSQDWWESCDCGDGVFPDVQAVFGTTSAVGRSSAALWPRVPETEGGRESCGCVFVDVRIVFSWVVL